VTENRRDLEKQWFTIEYLDFDLELISSYL
jgi:hypothetical protein